MDRMRESMFSILGDLSGLSFLDLFAGSGIVGVEAASRGASPILFVERDRKKYPALKKNIAFVQEETAVHGMDVILFLKTCSEAYDIIYLDPPFARADKEGLVRLVNDRGILKSEGRLLLHHPRGENYPESVGSLTLERTKIYGGSFLRFYRNT